MFVETLQPTPAVNLRDPPNDDRDNSKKKNGREIDRRTNERSFHRAPGPWSIVNRGGEFAFPFTEHPANITK